MIVRLQDNPHIIVKPETYPITVTGNTYYNFIASGETVITQVQTGNLVDVTIYNPSGSSVNWGLIVGDITNQTDLTDYVTAQISASTSGLTSSWSGLTGLPSDNSDLVDYVDLQISAATSGLTSSWSGLTGLPSDNSDLVDYVASEISGASTTIIGSGGTWAGLLSGTTWIVYSPDWTADILGLTMSAQTAYECCTGNTADIAYISGQTDYHYQQFTGFTDYFNTLVLPAITGNTADIAYVSGQTEIAQQCCTGLTASFDSHTGNTDLHFYQSAITVTESQISDLGDYALQSDFTGHTSDLTIHYPQSGITIAESQVTNLVSDLASKSDTGHTHTLDNLSDVTITSPVDYDIIRYSGTSWVNDVTLDLFAYVDDGEILYRNGTEVSGITQSTFSLSGHSHAQYLTGYTVTAGDVTGITSTLYSVTAHTHSTYVEKTAIIVSLTASTILDNTYANKIIEIDSTGATTITLPSGMTTGMQVSIVNVNTGDVTIAAQGTLQGIGTILATQYTKAEAYHRGSDVWLITGTLTT